MNYKYEKIGIWLKFYLDRKKYKKTKKVKSGDKVITSDLFGSDEWKK